MLEMKSAVNAKYIRARASNRRTQVDCDWQLVDNSNALVADGLISSIWFGFNTSGVGYAAFFAASKTKPASGTFFKCRYNGTATGIDIASDSGTGAGDVGNFSINITDEGENGNFTTLYNACWDDTLDRAGCFAKLQSIYGEDYIWFGMIGYINSLTMPAIYGNYQWGFYADPDNPTKIDSDCTNSWTPAVIDPTMVEAFNSLVAIDPEYIENIGTDNMYRAFMYFVFSPSPTPPEKLIFDVYIDGVIGGKGPNIQIRWRNDHPETSQLSPELIKPHIWGFGYFGAMTDPTEYVYEDDNDVYVPDDRMEGGRALVPKKDLFAFTDEGPDYSYVGYADEAYYNWNSVERVTAFGLDGIPQHLGFFLRFDYIMDGFKWGDLYCVTVPYEYEGAVYVDVQQISDSSYVPQYLTEVNIIGGTPPDEVEDDPDESEQGYDDEDDESGDGPYPDPDDQPDISDYDSTGYPGEAVLTKTYKLSKARLQDVGAKLWSQSYFDVLKIQSNPIENIIACRWYPMDITGGSDESIVIGDVDIQTNGSPIGTTYRKTIGTYTYKGIISENGENLSPGYLAQSPYATLKLHLPYVGCVQLDASEVFNRELSIEYIVDIVTGDVLVLLKLGSHKMPYMSLSGKMGVDIPISGTDRAQIQIAAATRAVTAVVGAAGQMIEGNAGKAAGAAGGILSMAGMDYSTQRTIQHSSVCASYDNRAIVLEMHVNKAHISEGYIKYHGLPSHQYMSLSKGMGFVQISKRTVIDVAMTDEENRQLEAIMTQGCYF